MLCIGLTVWFTLLPLPVLLSCVVELCFREKLSDFFCYFQQNLFLAENVAIAMSYKSEIPKGWFYHLVF